MRSRKRGVRNEFFIDSGHSSNVIIRVCLSIKMMCVCSVCTQLLKMFNFFYRTPDTHTHKSAQPHNSVFSYTQLPPHSTPSPRVLLESQEPYHSHIMTFVAHVGPHLKVYIMLPILTCPNPTVQVTVAVTLPTAPAHQLYSVEFNADAGRRMIAGRAFAVW
jgi:hypothetical protein